MNRPMRVRGELTLTIGQNEGDLQGSNDKIIQAGIEYLHRVGGGTLHILPGVYLMQNAVYLSPNITLRGSGEKTVLKKAGSVVTALVRDSDWFEYGVEVGDAKGFTPGGGIMLRSKTGTGDWQFDVRQATVIAIEGNVLFLDRLTKENFWTEKDATAATIFPILTAENVDNVVVEDIVLDGSREQNEHINGNFAGAVFIQHCNKWRFRNVTAQNYNGDGYSFQVCDDIHFESCRAIDNADLGFHPGSGSQRPTVRNCIARRNGTDGLFLCWRVRHGLFEDNVLEENGQFGISIGHKDSDNLFRHNTSRQNKQNGLFFRNETVGMAPHRNRFEENIIENNGGPEIRIRGEVNDLTFVKNMIRDTQADEQEEPRIGILIEERVGPVLLQDNTFFTKQQIEDKRPSSRK